MQSRRQIALVVLALLLAVLFVYPGSGLALGWSSTEHGGIHRFHTVVWGINTGLVLSVGLFALLLRTDERVATAQQVGVAMVVMVTVFFGSVVIPHVGEPAVGIDRLVFTIMVLVLTGMVLVFHPRRSELLTTGRSISKPMAAFGVIGLAVTLPYALDQLQVQLATDMATDPHSAPGKEHWAEMASTALTLPLIALVAALRTRGFRLVAWTAGLGTTIFGAASAVLPDQASSPGVAWGAVAVLGGALFIVVAEIEGRRQGVTTGVTQPRGPSPGSTLSHPGDMAVRPASPAPRSAYGLRQPLPTRSAGRVRLQRRGCDADALVADDEPVAHADDPVAGGADLWVVGHQQHGPTALTRVPRLAPGGHDRRPRQRRQRGR